MANHDPRLYAHTPTKFDSHQLVMMIELFDEITDNDVSLIMEAVGEADRRKRSALWKTLAFPFRFLLSIFMWSANQCWAEQKSYWRTLKMTNAELVSEVGHEMYQRG